MTPQGPAGKLKKYSTFSLLLAALHPSGLEYAVKLNPSSLANVLFFPPSLLLLFLLNLAQRRQEAALKVASIFPVHGVRAVFSRSFGYGCSILGDTIYIDHDLPWTHTRCGSGLFLGSRVPLPILTFLLLLLRDSTLNFTPRNRKFIIRLT